MTDAQQDIDPNFAGAQPSPIRTAGDYLLISNKEWIRSCSDSDPILIERLLAKAKSHLDAGKNVAIQMPDESSVLLSAHRPHEIQEISDEANRTREKLKLSAVLHPT